MLNIVQTIILNRAVLKIRIGDVINNQKRNQKHVTPLINSRDLI